jgi:glycosyltransferase involved in cell wall biosynthesis
MRVLVDARHLNKPQQSGVGEYTVHILRALFDLPTDDTYTLLTTGRRMDNTHMQRLSNGSLSEINHEGRRSRQHVRDGVTRTHLYVPNKLLNIATLAASRPTLDYLADTSPDVVFLPNLNIAALPAETPHVLTVHDLTWRKFPAFYPAKMRVWHHFTQAKRLITGSTRCICPSKSTARDLGSEFEISNTDIDIVPHGIDETFQPKRRAQDHGIRSKYGLPNRFALFLGTIEPRKNVESVIKGVRAYRREYNDDIKLVIAGGYGWKHRSVRQLVRNHEWIIHLGHVRSDERPALYREADVFIWPSIYEGFGLPVLEALACGTPTITSRTSSLPEITKDAALLIDPHNINDIVIGLEQILCDETLSATLSKKSLARATEFSWQTAAKLTRNSLKSAL